MLLLQHNNGIKNNDEEDWYSCCDTFIYCQWMNIIVINSTMIILTDKHISYYNSIMYINYVHTKKTGSE